MTLMKIMKYNSHRFILFLLLLCIPIGMPSLISASLEKHKSQNVLVVNSYHPGYSWSDDIMLGIQNVLSQQMDVDLIIEHLDTKRYFTESYLRQMEELFSYKYKSADIDLLITSDDNALDFILRIRKKLFPNIPLVFCGIDHIKPERIASQEPVYGIEEADSILSTIDLILSIHPEIESVTFIADNTSTGRLMADKTKMLAASYQKHVRFDLLYGMTIEDLLGAINNISDNTVIFYLSFIRDKNDVVFSIEDSMKLIAENANVPVYCSWGFQPDTGVMGGNILSGYKQGELAAIVAGRLLGNESIKNIPAIQLAPLVYKFDYKALNRFNIDESKIPQNSTVYNKPSSFFLDHKTIILTTLLVICSLSFFIILLAFNIQRRKQSEKSLKKVLDGLEIEIMDRTFDLTEANKDLNAEVTERKQAEERLKENESKLQKAQKIAHVGFWDLGVMTGNLSWSDETFRIYGFEPQEFVPTFEKFLSVLHPEDHERVQKNMDMALSGETEYDLDFRYVRPDGKVGWIYCRAEVTRDDLGKPRHFFGTQIDITERKQAEEALENSKKLLDSIIEQSPYPTWIADTNGTMIRANPALKEVLKLTDEQLIGKYNLFQDDQLEPHIIQMVKDALENGETNNYELDWIGEETGIEGVEEGNRVYCEGTIFPIYNQKGDITNAVITYKDSTEKKQAEEELTFLSSITQKITDSILVTDTDFEITYINKAAEDLFGYSFHELKGLSPDILNADSEHEEIQQNLYDTVSRGETFLGESLNKRKDGSLFECEYKVMPLKNKQEEIYAYVGIQRDVTARKRAEEERGKLEEQLRQAQKMESIGTLAGGIAHDFNNILGIIVGNTELAMDDVPEWNPARYNLEEIRKASLRARDMVKQILSFSRQTKQEAKPIRISPIIEESLKLIRSSIPTTIEIRQNYSAQIDTILADPTQINQILMNLCTNANHAMREKGGTLEVGLKNMDLDEGDVTSYHDSTPGKYVVLTVSDTGHGMEPNIIERIFDPYFSTKEIDEGTGMGLAVVHGIVKNHNGAIDVYSEPGKGTTFNLFFPLIESETVPESTILEPLPTGTARILLVDDEAALADLGKRMLERLGYEVSVRTRSIEALEAFKAQPNKFDLLLTDMTMPNMTGKELAQELLRIRPDFPIILCTGYSETITEESAQQIGIKGFVMKPLVIREIAETIRRVLEQNGIQR